MSDEEENEDDCRVTLVRGPMFTDHLLFAPPKWLDDEERERLLDRVVETVVEGVKGAKLTRKYFRSGNVEDHVDISVPSALFKPRAKALTKAAMAAKKSLEAERYSVVVFDYDPKTRTKRKVEL